LNMLLTVFTEKPHVGAKFNGFQATFDS
jgi:hypothetical protein